MKLKNNDDTTKEIPSPLAVEPETCPVKEDVNKKLREIVSVQLNLAKNTLESAIKTLNDLFTLLDEGND